MKRGNEKESRKTEHSASFVDRTVQTAEEEDGDSPKSVLLSLTHLRESFLGWTATPGGW